MFISDFSFLGVFSDKPEAIAANLAGQIQSLPSIPLTEKMLLGFKQEG